MAAVTVIGAGYVGLVTSACFAWLGHNVRCVETDASRISHIRSGSLPFQEPRLNQLVSSTTASGNLLLTGEIEESLTGSSFAFLAVPTPPFENGEPDLRAVMSSAGVIKENAADGTIVVIKSTVPVGTGDSVALMLGDVFPVVNNPEFLREGTAVQDFLEPDRIVIGAEDQRVADAVARLYSRIDAPVMTTDRKSAELAKYASNAYLAVRLSFANEISRISQATGADIDRVMGIVAADHRIGPHYLRTGIGWGGSCLPKDVAALTHTAGSAGIEPHMLNAAQVANAEQIEFLVSTLTRQLGDLDGKIIGMMGTAFKPGTDDVRESPAIVAAKRLVLAGAHVRVHDPIALANTAVVAPELERSVDLDVLTSGSDAVILATDAPEYLSVDWERVALSMRGDTIFDARNALDADSVRRAGLRYTGYGRRPAGSSVTSE